MNRRQVLRAGSVAVAALLVGCRDDAPEVSAGEPTDLPSPDIDASPRPPVSTPSPIDEPDAPTTPEPIELPEPEPEPPPTVRIDVLCRDAIGLLPAGPSGVEHRIERVTLHHTAVALGDNALAPSRLRGHQRFHQEQGWSDIAYHYGIDLEGNIYELRRPDLAGDTFTEYDPTGHLLLLCEGNYDVESPTDPQLTSVAELIAYGAQQFGLDPGGLTGHRDHAATSCPGDNLYARLPELSAEALRLTDAASYDVDLRCGDTARRRVAAIEAGT